MIKKYLQKIIIFLVLVSVGLFAKAQPFANEIAAFKKQDSLSFPGTGKILFVGSSSFTLWKDVQQYFPEYPIINRGFGGSSLTDLIRYAPDVIFPYEPKQIVIYCGENDFAGDTSLYPSQVAQRFFDLFNLIRSRYKKVPIAYISMKPSPSRQHLMARFNVANVMIKNFIKKKRRTAFIDVYKAMLKENGQPKDEIFLADKLHMNAEGYKIWKKIIEPYLLKD
ncbi:MAG TPA: GDSL-type esterase/lipase family protein [Chitinophagaceae bacterium]|nr:GDSL-type esterase/lipase family protein [Chitinophagaceae bacterium]HRF19984.1 GDSL-type esterase/lipase family protein [Chitinophagaceae bacterium]